MQEDNGKYIFGVVKVGDRGQIVIPKDAREIYGIKAGDSLLVLGDNHYPGLYDIALRRDSAHFELISARSAKTNPRGDARAFDQIGIPSLVFTTLNGMQHNRVTTDVWENIDRRILTAATQVMAETVRELSDGIYQGRSRKSKARKFIE